MTTDEILVSLHAGAASYQIAYMDHDDLECAALEIERKNAEIAELRAENTNLRAAMDSIRSIVLASRTLEQLEKP